MTSLRQIVEDSDSMQKADEGMTDDEYMFFRKNAPVRVFEKTPEKTTETVAEFTIPWETYEENADLIAEMAEKGYIDFGESAEDYPNHALIFLLQKGRNALMKIENRHKLVREEKEERLAA